MLLKLIRLRTNLSTLSTVVFHVEQAKQEECSTWNTPRTPSRGKGKRRLTWAVMFHVEHRSMSAPRRTQVSVSEVGDHTIQSSKGGWVSVHVEHSTDHPHGAKGKRRLTWTVMFHVEHQSMSATQAHSSARSGENHSLTRRKVVSVPRGTFKLYGSRASDDSTEGVGIKSHSCPHDLLKPRMI